MCRALLPELGQKKIITCPRGTEFDSKATCVVANLREVQYTSKELVVKTVRESSVIMQNEELCLLFAPVFPRADFPAASR